MLKQSSDKMKKVFALLLAILFIVSLTAVAASAHPWRHGGYLGRGWAGYGIGLVPYYGYGIGTAYAPRILTTPLTPGLGYGGYGGYDLGYGGWGNHGWGDHGFGSGSSASCHNHK